MKKYAIIAALGIAAASMTACGGAQTASTTETASAAETAASTAASGEKSGIDITGIKELEDGILTVGTNAEFPPFEYVDDQGMPAGFDIALINAVAEKLGVKTEIQNLEFDALVASIGSKVECSIAGMTITEERAQAVNFSNPYYEAVQDVLVPADSAIAGEADLQEKKIGSQLGTTGNLIADETKGAESVPFNRALDAVQKMMDGGIDCVIVDQNPAQVFASQFADKVKLMDGENFAFSAEEYAIAMPKGNQALTDAVNAALDAMKADGTFDKLVEEYITGYSAE